MMAILGFILILILEFYFTIAIVRNNRSFALLQKLGVYLTRWEGALAAGCILLFIIVMNVLNVLQFRALSYNVPEDLANHAQALWNTLHGRFFFFTVQPPLNHLAHHFTFIGLLLLPIFALYPHIVNLYAQQIVLVGLSAILLFLFARRRLKWPGLGLVLVISFFCYPPLYQTVLHQFDYEILTIPAWLLTLYCFFNRQKRGFLIAAILTLLCREEEGALLFCLGIYAAVKKEDKFFIVAPCLLGLAGLLIAWQSMIFFSAQGINCFEVHGRRILGMNDKLISQVMDQIRNNWELAFYVYFAYLYHVFCLLILLVPLYFLGLSKHPGLLLVVLPIVIRNLLVVNTSIRYYVEIIPFVFFALLLALPKIIAEPPALLSRRLPRERHTAFFLIFLLLANINLHHAALDNAMAFRQHATKFLSRERWTPNAAAREEQQLIAKIPDGVSVAAPGPILPAIFQRPFLYRTEDIALHFKLAGSVDLSRKYPETRMINRLDLFKIDAYLANRNVPMSRQERPLYLIIPTTELETFKHSWHGGSEIRDLVATYFSSSREEGNYTLSTVMPP